MTYRIAAMAPLSKDPKLREIELRAINENRRLGDLVLINEDGTAALMMRPNLWRV